MKALQISLVETNFIKARINHYKEQIESMTEFIRKISVDDIIEMDSLYKIRLSIEKYQAIINELDNLLTILSMSPSLDGILKESFNSGQYSILRDSNKSETYFSDNFYIDIPSRT